MINDLEEKIQDLRSNLGEAWEIIDTFTYLLRLLNLVNDSKLHTVYKRAMKWLEEYEKGIL